MRGFNLVPSSLGCGRLLFIDLLIVAFLIATLGFGIFLCATLGVGIFCGGLDVLAKVSLGVGISCGGLDVLAKVTLGFGCIS